MNIQWKKKKIEIEALNELSNNVMPGLLNIRFTEIGDNYLKATMPVNPNTHQQYGLLHGGASATLAETIGSVASWLTIDAEKQMCLGMEINCNHLRPKKEGIVTATVEPIHVGAKTHVWDIKIHDEKQKLICVSRLMVAILNK